MIGACAWRLNRLGTLRPFSNEEMQNRRNFSVFSGVRRLKQEFKLALNLTFCYHKKLRKNNNPPVSFH
jgi:hypothetical protein